MTETQIARLDSRALISVTGEGWRAFLQGLITNDVEQLGEGEMRFAALLTPQGRFLFDMFVIAREDGCWLDVQASRRELLVERLLMYRLRAKVTIEAVEGIVRAQWHAPFCAFEWLADPRADYLGCRSISPLENSDYATASEEAYDWYRLQLGVPDPARDCVPDKTYPLEANFDLFNAIDFKKGCFIGQETTSRMKRRGTIKTRMLPIDFDGPPPPFGAEVMAGDLRAGEVLSGVDGRAMALLRLDRTEGASLTVDGHPVSIGHVGRYWMRPPAD